MRYLHPYHSSVRRIYVAVHAYALVDDLLQFLVVNPSHNGLGLDACHQIVVVQISLLKIA